MCHLCLSVSVSPHPRFPQHPLPQWHTSSRCLRLVTTHQSTKCFNAKRKLCTRAWADACLLVFFFSCIGILCTSVHGLREASIKRCLAHACLYCKCLRRRLFVCLALLAKVIHHSWHRMTSPPTPILPLLTLPPNPHSPL